MATGLEFVQSLLVFAGAVMAAAGLVLWMFETGPEDGLEDLRRTLAQRWRDLDALPWGRVPGCLTAWLAARVDRLVTTGFAAADRGIAFGGLVFGLLFGVIPAAALVNALIGGSQFLFWYYASLLAALAFLNFAGESGRLRALSAAVAAYLGLSLLVVIPVYVVRSFTDHAINTTFSHGVLQSLLVAVFWYLAAYGTCLAIDAGLRFRGVDPDRSRGARFAHRFLAAVPAAFVLTFLGLLAGHLAVGDPDPGRSWPMVVAVTGAAALALPVTLGLMARAGAPGAGGGLALAYGLAFAAASGLALAAGLAMHAGTGGGLGWTEALNVLAGLSADGARVYLGPDFWVMHLPFLPLAAFAGALAFGAVTKAAVRALRFGPGAGRERPFLAPGLGCGGMAVVLWGTAIVV